VRRFIPLLTIYPCGFPIQIYPVYPEGQEREVTVCKLENLLMLVSATTNFVKPAKEKLVVYELWFVILMPIEAIRRLINRLLKI
jgi:hypothetical protein